MSLPTDAATRKTYPVFRGLFKYFPDAVAEVSHVSFVANEQHNPGQELHWAKGKSSDHDDALLRHLLDRIAQGPFDTDGLRHRAKAAWRALAALQEEIEAEDKQRRIEEFDGFPETRSNPVPANDDYRTVVESYEAYLEALGENAESRLQGRD